MATNMDLLNAMRGLAGTAGVGAQVPPQGGKPSFPQFLQALLTGQDPTAVLPPVNSPLAALGGAQALPALPTLPDLSGLQPNNNLSIPLETAQWMGGKMVDGAKGIGSMFLDALQGISQPSDMGPMGTTALAGLMPQPAPDAYSGAATKVGQAFAGAPVSDAEAALIDAALAKRGQLDTEALKGAGPTTLTAKPPVTPNPVAAPVTGTKTSEKTSTSTSTSTSATVPYEPEAIVSQIQSGQIGPSKELMNSLPEEEKGFLAGMMDNEEFMVPFMMAMSLFSGKNFDEAAISGLQARQGILNRKERKEDKAEAKAAATAEGARKDAELFLKRQEVRQGADRIEIEQQRLRQDAAKTKADIELAQARATEAKAAAEKSLQDATQSAKPITDQQYAKLLTDQVAAIQTNNNLAETPVADPQFEAAYTINSALPQEARRKIPFNTNDQNRLKDMLSDPNIPEADARTAVEKALVVYGEDVVKAWLNSL